jgi:hypothetical protein
MRTLYLLRRNRAPKPLQKGLRQNQSTNVVMEPAMINWPEIFPNAEAWADGFWAGAATVSLIGIAGAAVVLVIHVI